ncbi:MAG: type secretion system protein, partial [Paucimonas sp.]|nr:type secretion system protein [Paucimonas sp.]
GDPQGTVWSGSAFIGGAASGNDPVAPLLPGRFSWSLSPAVLLGRVNATVENASALSQPLKITGSWHQWEVSPSSVLIPADRLSALGAPLNTVQLSGNMRLSWTPLALARRENDVDLNGTMKLEMTNIASRLSAIKPLGAYDLTMDWQGNRAAIDLKTVKGPMLLSGGGSLANGRFQFSGTADAEAGQEERLANLLNLLGQKRQVGNRNIIALEFKS